MFDIGQRFFSLASLQNGLIWSRVANRDGKLKMLCLTLPFDGWSIYDGADADIKVRSEFLPITL
jgi:hypothetical protein